MLIGKVSFISILIFLSVNLFAEEEINRNNVSIDKANPLRVKTDQLFYAKLGYGGIMSDYNAYGVAGGLGYRYEMDNVGVDISLLNCVFGQNGNDGFGCNFVQLQGLYFFNPLGNSSPYCGAGIGYSLINIDDNDGNKYSGNGIAGIATLGFETMRVSTIRLFIQIDATMPFFKLKGKDNAVENKKIYSPTFMLSMGIGF
jgi:hypothetical protein